MALTPAKTYLVAYNIVQLCGWLFILTQIVRCVLTGEDLWRATSPPLKVFQTMAVLEVAHTAMGLVRSNTMITGLQVASRLFVLWCVLDYSTMARVSYGFSLTLICWTIAEIVRYAFYALNLVGMDVDPVVWARYSLFLVLYPLGITGELWTTYAALPKIASEQPFSVGGFNWVYYMTIMLMLSYIPVFPKLFGHMLSQRRKTLTSNTPEKPRKRNE
ncbi:hypothetical protein RvY_10042 [Ramazzottius varieornatus]|uniref:Very-long-chain (3R)-3-hydroxyacyl-CoA dehydratase n=1 Tax=Ramazzottius varieornatus TaxID=947166 RepID=A0A1D1VBG1_RAMVA|nr:hypothetical protein RvY_10042 [Ramazzottius varieornatus]